MLAFPAFLLLVPGALGFIGLSQAADGTVQSIESLVQRSLPGLTRREHHSLSLDSAMPLTGGEPAPTKSNKP